MTRDMWLESRGFDPQFDGKGGGLANHDIWKRLCDDRKNDIVILLGEGTFHQFHGGAATNSPVGIWPLLNEDYKRVRGEHYQFPNVVPIIFGRLSEASSSYMLSYMLKDSEKHVRKTQGNPLPTIKTVIRQLLGSTAYEIIKSHYKKLRKFQSANRVR
jgi:hypothetical protein